MSADPPPSAIADRLRAAVRSAAARFQTLTDREATARPAPGKWSRKEILGHLIDSASNNHQRFVRAQIENELSFPGYEQDAWVRTQDHGSADWRRLIDLWAAYNEHLAHVIARIPPPRLATPLRIGGHDPITLGALVEDYLRHLEHHVAQIVE
jgi:hypothetical protein